MGRARSSAGGSVLDSHRGWSEGGASVYGQAVRHGALPPGRWPLPALHTSASSGRPTPTYPTTEVGRRRSRGRN